MTDVYERLAPIAARERAAMERGDTLDVVMARLKEEGIRAIEAHIILRQIKHVAFGYAKTVVDDAWHGSCPRLDLDDLALMASMPRVCKAVWWLPNTVHDMIARRESVMRVEPGDRFAERRDSIKRAIAEEPDWAREIAVVRDEPEVFEIRFVRIPSAR
jgi:hypothetical protein